MVVTAERLTIINYLVSLCSEPRFDTAIVAVGKAASMYLSHTRQAHQFKNHKFIQNNLGKCYIHEQISW